MRAQKREPVQDVRVAAELPKGAHPWVLGVEIVQKVASGALIIVGRMYGERGGERFSSPLEKECHRITWRRKGLPYHDWTGGTGRSRLATARAYCSMTSRGEI